MAKGGGGGRGGGRAAKGGATSEVPKPRTGGMIPMSGEELGDRRRRVINSEVQYANGELNSISRMKNPEAALTRRIDKETSALRMARAARDQLHGTSSATPAAFADHGGRIQGIMTALDLYKSYRTTLRRKGIK